MGEVEVDGLFITSRSRDLRASPIRSPVDRAREGEVGADGEREVEADKGKFGPELGTNTGDSVAGAGLIGEVIGNEVASSVGRIGAELFDGLIDDDEADLGNGGVRVEGCWILSHGLRGD